MRSRFVFFLLIVAAVFNVAGAKKKPKAIVRFYGQVPADNGKTFATEIALVNGQGTIWISKIATVSENDITAFYPFENPDGSAGAYFMLDQHGKLLLDTLSVEQRGQYVAVVINGRHVIDLLIDKRISDGVAVVPSGLHAEDLILLKERYQIVGEPKGKK